MCQSLKLLAEDIDRAGFAVASSFVPGEILERLRRLCSEAANLGSNPRTGAYGVRQLFSVVPEVRECVSGSPFRDLACRVLGDSAHVVKGTYFDKTADANWPVPWHQDVTITVRKQKQIPGFEFRPVRQGAAHAIPPVEVSESLLALRIHLDDAGTDHGALRVIPGSHRVGRLSPEQVQDWVGRGEKIVAVAAGDVMLMRPLLLHASSPCQRPGNRRVIHVEFAAADLPGGLQWAG